MRLRGIPIRVSPKEIIVAIGLAEDALYIECETVRECDEAYSLLKKLREGNNEVGQLGERAEKLLSELSRAGLLDESGWAGKHVAVIGDSEIAKILREKLKNIGLNVTATLNGGKPDLMVLALDFWSPSLLSSFEKKARREGLKYLPVYLVLDIGVIGPYMKPKASAGYRCFERQLTSNLSWIARVVRDRLTHIEYPSLIDNISKTYLDFLASFATLLLPKALVNESILMDKVVLIDFKNVFIDVVRVYRTPLCDESLRWGP